MLGTSCAKIQTANPFESRWRGELQLEDFPPTSQDRETFKAMFDFCAKFSVNEWAEEAVRVGLATGIITEEELILSREPKDVPPGKTVDYFSDPFYKMLRERDPGGRTTSEAGRRIRRKEDYPLLQIRDLLR